MTTKIYNLYSLKRLKSLKSKLLNNISEVYDYGLWVIY